MKRTGAGYKDRMATFDTVGLHKMVRAIRCMALAYRRRESGHCPLCTGAWNCNECAWKVIAGIDCVAYAVEWANEHEVRGLDEHLLVITALRQSFHPAWVRHRLRMLKRWEGVLMREIAERD